MAQSTPSATLRAANNLVIDGHVAHAVRQGLLSSPKSLPPWLFYDKEGSRLFERITKLPEYYLTRAERSIFKEHADDILDLVQHDSKMRIDVAELGAGLADKSQLILSALARRQPHVLFYASDISVEPLRIAEKRLGLEEPRVEMHMVEGSHEHALLTFKRAHHRQLILFIGSSIGNYDDEDAVSLLTKIQKSLRPDGIFLLGTDLCKSTGTMLRAYDDSLGVTSAFNLNVLSRINRELGGHFDLHRFRHRARWNAAQSRIEMHLESTRDQTVRIDALGRSIFFAEGETIHTESSVKYDDVRVDAIFSRSGLKRLKTYCDSDGLFAVHIAQNAH